MCINNIRLLIIAIFSNVFIHTHAYADSERYYIYFHNHPMKEEYIKELERLDLHFRVAVDGRIWLKPDSYPEVPPKASVVFFFLAQEKHPGPTISFKDVEEKEFYLKKLRDYEIPYVIWSDANKDKELIKIQRRYTPIMKDILDELQSIKDEKRRKLHAVN